MSTSWRWPRCRGSPTSGLRDLSAAGPSEAAGPSGRRVVEPQRTTRRFPQAGRVTGAGDAAGSGHAEDTARGHDESPARRVCLEAMVPTAQAAQIGAVGRPAVGMRHHVVEIGPAGAVATAGMSAGAVAGADVPRRCTRPAGLPSAGGAAVPRRSRRPYGRPRASARPAPPAGRSHRRAGPHPATARRRAGSPSRRHRIRHPRTHERIYGGGPTVLDRRGAGAETALSGPRGISGGDDGGARTGR